MIQLNITKGMTIRAFVAVNLDLIIALNKYGYTYKYIASQLMDYGVEDKHAMNIKYYVHSFRKDKKDNEEEITKYTIEIKEALKAGIFNTLQVVENSQSNIEHVTAKDKVILTDDNLKSAVVNSSPNVNPRTINTDERYEYVMSFFDVTAMDETSKKGLSNKVIRSLETFPNNDKDSLKLFAYSSFKNYEKQNLRFNQ